MSGVGALREEVPADGDAGIEKSGLMPAFLILNGEF